MRHDLANLGRRARRPLTGLVLSASLCALLVGCSSSSADTQPFTEADVKTMAEDAREAGYSHQADLLADGKVTSSEYEQAFRNLTGCLQKHGYTSSDPIPSPVDGLSFQYVVDFAGFSDKVAVPNIEECKLAEIDAVERAYLRTHTHRMDPQLLSAVVGCLRDDGVQPSGKEVRAAQLRELSGVTDQMLSGCIHENAPKLFPQLQSLTWGY